MSTNEELWLVAVSAGRWQISGIRAALNSGLKVLALDGDHIAQGMEIATKSVVVDIKDPNAVLTAIESSGIRPVGVVSFVSEVGMKAAAAIRERYGLEGPDCNLTYALTNKVRQREIWEKAQVPGPCWRAFRTVPEALVFAPTVGFPCVIKPADSSGSRGVSKLESDFGLEDAARKALESSHSTTALIEAFISGKEYAVETFGDGQLIHVLAVTEKTKVPGTNGTVAQELSTLANTSIEDTVANTAVLALQALGYLTGPGHTEVIVDDQGTPRLVEAAGRGGGFMVFEKLIEKASGYDVVSATALQAIGKHFPKITRKQRAVTLRFFPSQSGVVTRFNGFSAANKIAGVEAGPFVSIGDHVGEVQGDADRLGYILAEGETPSEAKAAADRAESLISFEVV